MKKLFIGSDEVWICHPVASDDCSGDYMWAVIKSDDPEDVLIITEDELNKWLGTGPVCCYEDEDEFDDDGLDDIEGEEEKDEIEDEPCRDPKHWYTTWDIEGILITADDDMPATIGEVQVDMYLNVGDPKDLQKILKEAMDDYNRVASRWENMPLAEIVEV